MDALDEGVGAVADPDDRDADLCLGGAFGRRLLRCSHSSVLKSFLDRAECEMHTRRAHWLQPIHSTSLVARDDGCLHPESSFRTCQTRWKTVKMVSAAIT